MVSYDTLDAAGLLCWLFRDELTSALVAEIDGLAGDDSDGMDDATRSARAAEIGDQILGLERSECATIEAAGGEDVIPYRVDTNPRAVLGLA